MELCFVRETFGSRFFVFYTRGGLALRWLLSTSGRCSPSRPSINRRPARFGLNAGVA